MGTRKKFAIKIAWLALIAGVVTAVLLAGRVKAFNPQPDPPAFGLISMNPGQTLRLNVVNTLTLPSEPDRNTRSARHAILGFDIYRTDARTTASEVPPASCITAHRFANRQSCEVTLAPGEAASFDLTSALETGMTQVMPVVQDDDHNKNPALIYTLEVRENGKTVQLMPAVQRGNTWAGRD